jgi:hypothetical protein
MFMKWAFSIRQKLTAALILAAVFVLIFSKNILDRNHVTQLGASFSEVYEDRLLVESYIFHLSELLYDKKQALYACGNQDSSSGMLQAESQNTRIAALLSDYGKTRLTPEEAVYFGTLRKCIGNIDQLEKQYLSNLSNEEGKLITRTDLNEEFRQAVLYLNRLSAIQIAEARNMNEASKKIMAGSALLTDVEFGILIIAGLLIQVLIFASKVTKANPQQRPELN